MPRKIGDDGEVQKEWGLEGGKKWALGRRADEKRGGTTVKLRKAVDGAKGGGERRGVG